ncbi:hypothetical protein [Thioalkalivibrio sp. K90mix]|uniref:hypothetical protein n=1 Tax=Thioalkalivibrio sp. (strain K90mix) TaxID=396595 RepID=UPI001FCBD776|nr:hypothetical protein [Thioalkalivibrio sp. K90mix]
MYNDENEIRFDLGAEPVRQESIDGVVASLEVRYKALKKRCTLILWLMLALASAPGSIPKGKLKAAVLSMKIRLENAPQNVSHVHSQFVEAMEAAKESAKTEVEGYIHGLSLQTGLESLREHGPRLLEKPDRGPEDEQGS